MKDAFKPHSLLDYIGAIFLFSVFFIGLTLFWKFAIKPGQNLPTSSPIILSAPNCSGSEDEYLNLVKGGQVLQLTKNQISYVENGRLKSEQIEITRSGEIACGYLYAKAHKGTTALNEKYDSIYINPQELGGHILRSRSIKVSEENNKTEILFLLSSVPFLPNVPYNPESQNYRSADWVKLISASDKTTFIIALSTLDPDAVIDEVSIAYKCWDQITGKETTDCQLSKNN